MKESEAKKLFEGKVKDCNNTNSIFNLRKYVLLEDAIEVVQLLNLDFVSKNEVAYCHAEKDYRQNECNGYCPHCEYHHTD